MTDKEKIKECDDCWFCNPDKYIVEVDIYFLRVMQNALENLRDYAPKAFAKGWLQLCEDKIEEVRQKYPRK